MNKISQNKDNTENLKLYYLETISKFMHNILEINKDEAHQNALAISNVMTGDVLKKLVHFFDYIEQCTFKGSEHSSQQKTQQSNCKSNSSQCSQKKCNSCCGNCPITD